MKPEDICKKCRGSCCKAVPGAILPADVRRWAKRAGRTMTQQVLHMFNHGYCVDQRVYDYDGFEEDFYLRPSRTIGKASHRTRCLDVYDLYGGGACTFLTRTGCSLQGLQRPGGCRGLVPRESGACVPRVTEVQAVGLWRKSGVLRRALKQFEGPK